MLPVVLLAGGLATRMRRYTGKIPKAMIDVAGKPFIHRQLTLLRKHGIEEVFLCLGYLGKMIEEYVGDGSRYGIKLSYYYDGDRLLGTGGAIKRIIGILPDSFFVIYGDSYLETHYKPIEESFLRSGMQGLMTVYKNQDLYDQSNVVYQNGRLIKYSKKNKTPDMHHIDYGLGILRKEAFNGFSSVKVFDLAEVYEKLVNDKQLMGYEIFERFHEIGSPSGLNELILKICREEGKRGRGEGGRGEGVNKAVFLDRDGVINPLVYNQTTGAYESPHEPDDFSVYPYLIRSLQLLKEQGYYIFVVSNQPSFAKGKTTLENIQAIEKLLFDYVAENGNLIDEYYYCYHHPKGIIPEYSCLCDCRKPGALFLKQAADRYSLDLSACFFVGDRDTDIQCGKAVGTGTIKILNKHSVKENNKEKPDFFAGNLYEAARKIVEGAP